MEIEKLVSLLLPEGLILKFDINRVEELYDIRTRKGEYHLWMDEKNELPIEKKDYESKGFYPEKTIQDFPIRGKGVFLHIRRRRWRDKNRQLPDIKSDFMIAAKGVKLTSELAQFLKGGGVNS